MGAEGRESNVDGLPKISRFRNGLTHPDPDARGASELNLTTIAREPPAAGADALSSA
jgi:hypothetical protein